MLRTNHGFGRTLLMSARAAAVLAVAWLAAVSPALAGKSALNDDEKGKLRDAIQILEGAWKTCASMTLENHEGPFGSSPAPICYEMTPNASGSADSTFKDAIAKLREMLAAGRIIKSDTLKARGTVRVEKGLDKDKIVINEKLLDEICAPGASAVDRMCALIQLVATLANETAHVFQKWHDTVRIERCDGERDSDSFSWKAMQAIYNALTKDDGTGMPHESLSGVLGDAQYTCGLGLEMLLAGVDTPAEIAALQKCVLEKFAFYLHRWSIFNQFILIPADWYDWYNGGSDMFPEGRPVDDTQQRDETVMRSGDDLITRSFSVPAGSLFMSRVTRTEDDRVALVQCWSDGVSPPTLAVYRDDDNDSLPELPAVSSFLLPLPFGPRALYNGGIYPLSPLHAAYFGAPAGMLLHDRASATMIFVATAASGEILFAQTLFIDPNIATKAPAHAFLRAVDRTDINALRLIFSSSLLGDSPVMWFDVFPGGVVLPNTAPGLSMAQAIAPENEPGIEAIHAGLATSVTLGGNPFAFLSLESVGQGGTLTIASGSTDSAGRTPPLPLAGPISGNDLYRVHAGISSEATYRFVPRVGVTIDTILADETSDGLADRLQVSAHPSRLHLLRATTPLDQVFQHEYEIALERDDYGGMRSWTIGDDRSLRVLADANVPLRRLNSPVGPLFAQSLLDFEGDGSSDDVLVIVRDRFSGAWQALYYVSTDPFGGGFHAVTMTLPPALEPGAISYPDLNGDLRPDVLIEDAFGGSPVCFRNTAGGPPATRFVFGSCVATPPCCLGNADGNQSVTFSDVTSVLANFNASYPPGSGQQPGDADCNGAVGFSDVTAVLANFGSPCP